MLRSLLMLLGAMLLAGCASIIPGPLTVQAAVAREAASRNVDTGEAVVAGPDVLLVRDTIAGTAAVWTMETEHQNGRMHLTYTSFFRREGMIWRSMSGSGAGGSGPREPVEFIPQAADNRFFYAYGAVSDPDVKSVRVTFANGVMQTVPVENGAYLAVTGNVGQAVALDALDEQGALLYQVKN